MDTPPKTAHSSSRVDFSKVVFYALVVVGSLALSFAAGLYSGATRTTVFLALRDLKTTVEDALKITAEEITTLAGVPSHFLQPKRQGGSGVTINDPSVDQTDLILMTGFFSDSNEVRLVRRNGDTAARWPVRFYDLFPDPQHFPDGLAPATDWNIELPGAAALPDGSVVFNFEGGGLTKLDRCGRVVWKLDYRTHHTVELAEGGGFWVPGRRWVESGNAFPPHEVPYEEDTILRISDDGQVVAEHSVVKLFYDSGLEALLTATGSDFRLGTEWDQELVHLNKIEELKSHLAADFPLFEAGDLALSLRDRNLVMVVAKDLSRIKWWKVGPWIRQHDPEFTPGGTIVVYNNNTYMSTFGTTRWTTPVSAPRVSNVLAVDPVSGESKVLWGGQKGQELLSVVRGNVDITPVGGLQIVEFEGGRVIETDSAGNVVWEYVNQYDEDNVAELIDAHVYPASYFTVDDWSCGK